MSDQSATPAKPASHAKSRLGRGLSSLVANSRTTSQPQGSPESGAYVSQASATDSPAPQASGAPRNVPVDQIQPNPYQPRRSFEVESLQTLADSITQKGILQPLVVSPAADPEADHRFVLIAGERRLRAAKMAGLESVPCVLHSADGQDMLEWALIENIHRADLNPVERALAYREYLDRFEITQAHAAQRLGEPRATIANHLRVLDLPAGVQEYIASGKLSFGHAKVLAGLAGDPDRQNKLAERCVRESLSVRRLEELAAGGEPTSSKPATPGRPAYLRDFEDQLAHSVGTRVVIKPGRSKNTGRIVIDYYNLDDFDRIVAGLGANLES